MPAPTWAQFAGILSSWLLPRSDVTVKAWYPTPAAMVAAGDAGYGDASFAPGDVVEAGGYRYVVAASGATDNHLINGALIKFYALPVNGELTPEQLCYTDAAANWGACAQIAWNAGYVLRLGAREYLTSTTAFIRSRTGVIGEGDRVSGVKAAAGFSGNIIDTSNFSARVSLGSVQNDDEVTNGALYGTVLRDFYIDGNRQNVPAGTATSGIGVRLYCRMLAVTNLRITYCAAHGMQTVLPSGTADPFDSLDHSRIGFVMGLWVMDCGREGWIFQGPADIPCDRVFIGNNGKAGSGLYDALSPTRSLVFPGETCDGLVLDNVGAEFANGHVWNHQHGRGIRIRTNLSGVRARFFNMISEGNWGQVDIGSGARVEFYGEIHGNDGGPRNERVFYDAVNVAGSPFAAGQTLTGMTSGAVGTITSIEERTATTGLIIVSFASDALREVRYQDNERVTNGSRQVTVYRPDYYGAVPWWRDDSMQGNLVSLKVFQTGLNDGGPMLRIGGQNHVYTVQAQSSTPRFGHGIDLYGDNVTLSGYVEGRARTAPNGQASAGLIVRAGAERANINLTVKSCQQSVLFEDDGLDSRFDITSIDPLADHFNGLATLAPAAAARANLIGVASSIVVWEGQATSQVTPEQLGYSEAAANWGVVAQRAWDAGLILRLGAREYLTSSTAYIRSRTGVVGEGSRATSIRAVDGFTGNVIDTQNFDTLAATDAVNHSAGVLQQPILRGVCIDGNRANFGAAVTASNGFGVRLYGRQMILDDVRIVRAAGVGLMMQLSQVGVVTETYHPKDHAKSGVLRDLFIYDTGEEGFIFRGPTDIRIDTTYVGWAAGSLGTSYNASKTSLHYPGETVDGMVFDNAGCEIGQIHSFDNKNGWGVKIRSNVVEIDYSAATAMTGVAPGTTMTGATSGATGVLVSKYANGWTGTLIVRSVSGAFQAGETISGGGGTATIASAVLRSPRFRCTDFMSERNYGQLWIGPQVRYEIEGEVHNNEGGAGARPMIEDNSVVGGLARFKAVRGGTENGSTIVELKGAKGLWNIQAQTPSARAGHGIDLSGTDYIVTAMVERASGTTFAGEASSGVIFRPGNARNRVTAKARECARSFWFQPGSCVDNVMDMDSFDHTGGAGSDYFGIGNLRFLERRNGRLLSSAANYACGQMFISSGALTVSSNTLAPTGNKHLINTSSAQTINSITAPSWARPGDRFVFSTSSGAGSATFVNNAGGTGNIRCPASTVLDVTADRIEFEYDGTLFVMTAISNNG